MNCKHVTEEEFTAMQTRVKKFSLAKVFDGLGKDLVRQVSTAAYAPYRSKLEQSYANYLHVLMLAGDIAFYKFEPLRLILGKDCTLQPDFLVMGTDGTLEFHEVKGYRRDDAMVKLRVAAKTFHWWKFVLVERKRGVWELKEMGVV